MPHFTRRIKTEEGTLNFYFNRLYTADGTRYHVSAMDTKRNTYHCNIIHTDGRWKLVAGSHCPDLIEVLEPLLEQIILDHLREIPDVPGT